MSDQQQREFPEWIGFYEQLEASAMPWFHPDLDSDLEQGLQATGLSSGKGLDLGTGPGTQAIELAKRGYDMTGSDLSPGAIRQAAELAGDAGIDWVVDDVLASGLQGPFDFIFDRGCFHVLAPADRPAYAATVAGLLKPGGIFFLKCFSHLQPGNKGPWHFTPEQIREIFAADFEVVSIHDTVYQGTLETLPKALFCILKRK